MRGTFVPLYGLNNMFGQIPIVGLFLGGSNEGLIGVTYEVVGPPDAPVLRVTAHDVPLPYAPSLEDFVLPQTADIVRAVRTLAAY